MADDKEEPKEEQDGAQEAGKPKGKKKGLLLGGGVVGILGLSFAAAMAAVPSKEAKPTFDGPFTMPLFENKFPVNLRDNDHKRFLQATFNVIYYAYQEPYAVGRTQDPLYGPYLRSAVISVASTKSTTELYDPAGGMQRDIGMGVFMDELRDAINPILFPVHVGDSKLPMDPDKESGLRPGFSSHRSSFRGRFHEHLLHVDAAEKTVRLDEGEAVKFAGDERDLVVQAGDGASLFLDVTGLHDDFVGDLSVGVKGEIVQVLPDDFVVQ